MNQSEMLEMLEISSIAYRDNQPRCRCSKLIVIENEATDAECFVRIGENIVIIAFRGTDSNINRFYNLCFAKKVIPYDNYDTDIRVHSGFLATYKSVRSRILPLIPEEAEKVVVTGHSLGAALSVLCAVDVQYNFKSKDVEAYLFGCPRVGNKAFAKSYDKRVFKTMRVSNGNDVVTKIPPKILGFHHVGIDIHTGSVALPLVLSFRDHTSQSYYRNLWTAMNFR